MVHIFHLDQKLFADNITLKLVLKHVEKMALHMTKWYEKLVLKNRIKNFSSLSFTIRPHVRASLLH